jgi:hypothetical protein
MPNAQSSAMVVLHGVNSYERIRTAHRLHRSVCVRLVHSSFLPLSSSYNTVQYSTVQYSTVQYSTVLRLLHYIRRLYSLVLVVLLPSALVFLKLTRLCETLSLALVRSITKRIEGRSHRMLRSESLYNISRAISLQYLANKGSLSLSRKHDRERDLFTTHLEQT